MVNITALQEITRFILSRNLKPMKKWSGRFRKTALDGRQSWYLKGLRRKVKFILNIISGNDIVEMIKGKMNSCYIFKFITNFFIRCFNKQRT